MASSLSISRNSFFISSSLQGTAASVSTTGIWSLGSRASTPFFFSRKFTMLMRVSIVLPANPLGVKKSFVLSQSRRVDFVQKLNPAQTFDEFVKCEAILLARLLGFVLFLFEVSIHDGAGGGRLLFCIAVSSLTVIPRDRASCSFSISWASGRASANVAECGGCLF